MEYSTFQSSIIYLFIFYLFDGEWSGQSIYF